MATAGSWRDEIFEQGAKYLVVKDYEFCGSIFSVGLVVEYESCGYERYDNTSLYRFYSTASERKELIWRLHDDEAESKANEYFERLA